MHDAHHRPRHLDVAGAREQRYRADLVVAQEDKLVLGELLLEEELAL